MSPVRTPALTAAARQIREKPHGRGMLLLALTGDTAPVDAPDRSAHEFDCYLVKPVDLAQLTHLLSDAADGSTLVHD